jgi:hypothetical protein
VNPTGVPHATDAARRGGRARDRPDARSSEIVLRNHDPDRSYAVTVELTPPGRPGATTAETYGLAAGEIRCLSTVAPRGRTRVRGRIATGATDATDATLGEEPRRTALVETGNGIVTVTHGL